MRVYYNEIDPYCLERLQALMDKGLIPKGDIDGRDIRDVTPAELIGYDQCHFFAGIGGWSRALYLAGWPEDRPVWTGSCPCQSFSAAGRRKGFADERHLWPYWYHLISVCRPPVVFGEQVASKLALFWLDLVFDDLEAAGYACGSSDLCAAGTGAPHIRQRLWFVGITTNQRFPQRECYSGISSEKGSKRKRTFSFGTGDPSSAVAHPPQCPDLGSQPRPIIGPAPAEDDGLCAVADPSQQFRNRGGHSRKRRRNESSDNRGHFWSDLEWLYCRDGKYRPTKPGLFPLAARIPNRMAKLRAIGNSIVPQVAAEFVKAASFIEDNN